MDVHDALWPEGGNKQLFYGMVHYIQQILQDHGTHLISSELIKLYKIKADMTSLLETINGVDFKIPDLNFTLPGLYKFYNNTIEETEETEAEAELISNYNPNANLLPTIPIVSSLSSSCRRASTPILSNISSASSSPNNIYLANNAILDDTANEYRCTDTQKYKLFDAFLSKLKAEHHVYNNENLNLCEFELSPQYLVFLEDARKQFNQENNEHIIRSLNGVPSLKSTLHKLRHGSQCIEEQYRLTRSFTSHLSHFEAYKQRNITEWSYNSNPFFKQHIAIKGYYNTFLSVYKNGTSQFKTCQIGSHEIFHTILISKMHNTNSGKMYIKTNDNLYLGSDKNGLLFIGNVTKHHQIWTLKMNANRKQITYSFKNCYGLYLGAYKNGNAIANSKYKKELQRFIIYTLDSGINVNGNITKKALTKRGKHKMSIDDMDINIPPVPVQKRINELNDAETGYGDKVKTAPKMYRTRKRGHFRRRSEQKIPIPPPPPPPSMSMSMGNVQRVAPPPRNKKNMYLKLGIPMVGGTGHNVHESILRGIKNANKGKHKLKRYRKSNEDIKLESYVQLQLKEKVTHRRSPSMVAKYEPLMDELRRKLKEKEKSAPIEIAEKEAVPLMDECGGGDDDEKAKPAVPNKSARLVEQQIRSKYQRPLPALPQCDIK